MRVFLFVLTFLSVSPSLGQSEEAHSRLRFLDWAHQDATDWITSSSLRRLKITAVSIAVLAPLSALDERIYKTSSLSDGTYGDLIRKSNKLGGPKAIWVPAGVFFLSLFSNSHRFQDAAFTSLQAPAYAFVLATLSKRVLIGRSRPTDGKGAHNFELLTNKNSSFPSGHAVTAFAIITPWAFYYPHPATYALMAVPVGTAIARIERRKHWMTDVVAGSTLGFMIGYWLSRKHQGKSSAISFAPHVGRSSTGMSLTLSF